MRMRSGCVLLALLVSIGNARAQETLSVASAQPTGELASLEQAAEIRVRFSEPMVPIGRLPDQVTAPFVAIRPAIAGTFRWAGPTLLVFTPDPKQPLPTATRYDVTIATTAAAVSGRTLPTAYTFNFTTPTVRLLSRDWYRLAGRYDRPAILALRFNQAVRPADVLAHVTARYQRHDWQRAHARCGRGARAHGRRRRRAVRRHGGGGRGAGRGGDGGRCRCSSRPTGTRSSFPPAADLVVLQTQAAPATDGWLQLTIDAQMPAVQGPGDAARNVQRQRTVTLDRTLFADGFRCRSECDADKATTPRALRAPVAIAALQRRGLGARRHRPRPRSRRRQAGHSRADAALARRAGSSCSASKTWASGGSRPSRTYAVSLSTRT